MTTLRDVITEEAAKYGVTVADADMEYVIWEETGYPCFWPDSEKTPEENFRMQVREWAENSINLARRRSP